MAFDGSIVHILTQQLQDELTDGRIVKIAQTEKDEIYLTIKKDGTQKKLLISVNPSLPVIYITSASKQAPLQAPAFCMLLRKHLTNGRIISISQPSMERIIEFEIEHFNEMGDICRKILTVELMGKYSNIIFREGTRIIDSIKHVSALVSSVREVLPGREYFIPFSDDKINPFEACLEDFENKVFSQGALSASKSLYTCITGFSPILSEEIMYQAGLDSGRPASSFTAGEIRQIFASFCTVMKKLEPGCSEPNIIYKDDEPVQFAPFHFKLYEDNQHSVVDYASISELLSDYYSQKQTFTSVRQKTADLRQAVHTLLNKDYKKYDLQLRQIRDTEKKDKFKVYGELLTAYGYSVEPGAGSFTTTNFYTGQEITIPLDPTVSAVDNGKNYFKKYSKLKRTADALNEIVVQTKEEIDHLESIMVSLEMVQNAADIQDLKNELIESGYIKGQNNSSGNKKSGKVKSSGGSGGKNPSKSSAGKSSPLHYISSDGFHMYVGKNNYQNEYLSFKLASGNDWWFHAKDIPGSHVIVKCDGAELTDKTFEEAASLAAHYCKSEGADKVEVQYTQKKNLKKPPAAKPGFVVFNTYYSMAARTDIHDIEEVK